MEQNKRFPKRVHPSGFPNGRIGWIESEVHAYLAGLAIERDRKAGASDAA